MGLKVMDTKSGATTLFDGQNKKQKQNKSRREAGQRKTEVIKDAGNPNKQRK